MFSPAFFSRSTSSRFSGLANQVTTLSAITAPISLIADSSSAEAAISASIVLYCNARSRPPLAPTWRIPRANSNLSSPCCLLFSIAFSRLSADFFPMRSSVKSCSSFKSYKSAGVFISSASSSCPITAGPHPSMSIASRDAKWISPSLPKAGQWGLVQRYAASPSFRATAQPHSGHFFGITNGTADSGRSSFTTERTSGIISAALLMMTVSPIRISFSKIKSSLCRVALLTVLPDNFTGVSTAAGVSTPVRPTWITISSSFVRACSGGYL